MRCGLGCRGEGAKPGTEAPGNRKTDRPARMSHSIQEKSHWKSNGMFRTTVVPGWITYDLTRIKNTVIKTNNDKLLCNHSQGHLSMFVGEHAWTISRTQILHQIGRITKSTDLSSILHQVRRRSVRNWNSCRWCVLADSSFHRHQYPKPFHRSPQNIRFRRYYCTMTDHLTFNLSRIMKRTLVTPEHCTRTNNTCDFTEQTIHRAALIGRTYTKCLLPT